MMPGPSFPIHTSRTLSLLKQTADGVGDVELAELNEKHALISEHGRVTIITEAFDEQLHRHVLHRSTAADFKLFLSNRFVQDGKKQVALGDWWLRHPLRRTYRSITFNPDPAFESNPEIYNLFRGWTVQPKAGSWSLFRQHLFEVGANGDERTFDFLLDWFAWLFICPHKPVETAIVWRGPQGAGKGMIARAIGRILGQHFMPVTQASHFLGRFNAHLQDVLLLFADEAFWAGDKSLEGILKALITEPMIVVERKGRDPIVMPNRIHLMMASNQDWVIPTDMGDRRFCVVDVPGTHVKQSSYFAAIHHELMESGGLEAMLWDLLHRQMDRPPVLPSSGAARRSALEQKKMSMSPIEQWFFTKLINGRLLATRPGWPDECLKSELHEDYLKSMESLNINRRASETMLGMALMKLLPTLRTTRHTEGYDRPRYWVVPSLEESRNTFCDIIRQPVDWENEA
jgi:hypothetical protein